RELAGRTFVDSQCLVLLRDRKDLALLDVVQEVGIALGGAVRGLQEPRVDERNGAENEHQHDDAVAQELGVQKWKPPSGGTGFADVPRSNCSASIPPGHMTTP